MAVLTNAERLQVWRGLMRWVSRQRQALDLSKTDLRAAIDATDDWIDTNAGAYNNALPTAAKNNLTAAQKTILFCVVAMRRVSVAALKSFVGEVD